MLGGQIERRRARLNGIVAGSHKRLKRGRSRWRRLARYRGRYTWLALLDVTTRGDRPRDRLLHAIAAPQIAEAREVVRRLGARPGKSGAARERSRLKREQAELLARMRADNESAGAPFAPSTYWRDVNARFDGWFRDDGIKDVGRQGFNAFFSTPEPGSRKYQRYALYMLYRAVADRDDRGLLDALVATDKKAIAFGRHAVTWDLLISLDTLYTLHELAPGVLDEPIVLVDLGAGWGRIGHVLLHANPAAAYVALDLPESLLVAQGTLPRTLPPDTPVTGYEATREFARFTRAALLAERGAFFCGPQALARFEPDSVDILVNVASFQEMTRAQVAAYLELADRTAAHVYLQERYEKPVGLPDDVIAGRDAYPIPAGWTRRFERPVRFSDLFFEAGYVTRS